MLMLVSYRPLVSSAAERVDARLSVWSWHNRARGCSRSLKTAGAAKSHR